MDQIDELIDHVLANGIKWLVDGGQLRFADLRHCLVVKPDDLYIVWHD